MVLEVKRAERTVEVCLDGSLVAEFEATNEAYKVAVEEKYRFFSFGDAMLIK